MNAVALAPGIRPLADRHIVVTRPAGQAQHLADMIAAVGGAVVLFPLLTIAELDDPAPLETVAARLEQFDLAVFISANAVERALGPILARRAWPTNTRVATVGRGSERALTRFGMERVIAPRERFDSEALLELPEMQQMAGRRVVIFRGDGGRELLAETLAARGASVECVSCYRRDKPGADASALAALWARRELDAMVVTSSEGLRNLHAMMDSAGREALAATPLFVPHGRIGEEARRLGLKRVIVTPPGDEGLVEGLVGHFSDGASGR